MATRSVRRRLPCAAAQSWTAMSAELAVGRILPGDAGSRSDSAAEMHHTLARAISARIITLPVGAAATVLTMHHLVAQLSTATFGIVMVLVSIPSLLAFADFGLFGAIVNVAAQGDPRATAGALRSAMRLLLLLAAVVSMTGAALAWFGAWPFLLGADPDAEWANLAGAIFLTCFGLTVPLGLGAGVLTGLQRTSVVVLVRTAQPLMFLVLALIFVHRPEDGSRAVLSFAFATLATVAAQFWVGLRAARISLSMLRDRSLPPSTFRRTALPMLVVTVAVPLTYQGGRWILAHRVDAAALSAYSVASQLFASALSVVIVAGAAFWGTFAAHRRGDDLHRLWHAGLRRAAWLGAALAVSWMLLTPLVSVWIAGGQAPVPRALLLSMGFMLLAEALHLPSGMLLTDAAGIRRQAMCASVAALTTLPATWVLVPSMGICAPIVAMLFCYGGFQILPCFFIARSRLSSESG